MNIQVSLKINERMHAVLLGETINRIGFVIVCPADKVIGGADIKSVPFFLLAKM
jgi:hypothetical protein